MLVLTLIFVTTGCDFLGNSSNDITKESGIEGTIKIEDTNLMKGKIKVGSNITKVNYLGEFKLLIKPGTYDVVINTLLNKKTFEDVKVKENEITNLDKNISFKELNISTKSFLLEREYYRPGIKDDNGDYGIWETTTIFNIMDGTGARFKRGEVTYELADNVPAEYKESLPKFLNKISDKVNNFITFKKVNSSADLTIKKEKIDTAGTTYLTWNGLGYITDSTVKIDSDDWNGSTPKHEIIHAVGLLGDAHLPKYDRGRNYDGTVEPMYYESTDDTEISQETWNTLKLKYSVMPTLETNPKYSSPIKTSKKSITVIDED